MKVLHINYFDNFGGAAKAAYRLHLALLENGIDSKILVQEKESNDSDIIGPNIIEKYYGKLRFRVDRYKLRKYKSKYKYFFSASNTPFSYIPYKINKISPDILHLHWFHINMFTIKDLLKIKTPIIWTVHDMWGLSGGCFVSINCNKFKKECGKCHILKSTNPNDISNKLFKEKKSIYKNLDITIVSPSKWLKREFEELKVFKNIINIPNITDINSYFKLNNKINLRKKYNIPIDKKAILFTAMRIDDINKGFQYLEEALEQINNKEIILLLLGDNWKNNKKIGKSRVYNFGFINKESIINEIYNIADITIVPSIQENFSNVILESMATETPVISFNIGGNKDIIDHKSNGYLANPYDPKDIAEGINWILFESNYKFISKLARESVLKKFDKNITTKKHINLYKKILKK